MRAAQYVGLGIRTMMGVNAGAIAPPTFVTGAGVSVSSGAGAAVGTTVAAQIPVWYATPTFTIQVGEETVLPLPVTVSGGGYLLISWVAPLPQPTWITLNSGVLPSISFDGTQVDGNDISGMVLSATANGQTVNSASGSVTVNAALVGLSFVADVAGYTSTNGTSTGSRPRNKRGQMWYESAYTTKDGTIIEHADGAHGRVRVGTDPEAYNPEMLIGTSNRVGEFDPLTGSMTEVYPDTFEDVGTFAYDNLLYLYFDRIDALVSFSQGVFSRALAPRLLGGAVNPSGDNMVVRTWTGPTVTDPYPTDYWSPHKSSVSNSGICAWTHLQATGTPDRFPRTTATSIPYPAGRPPVFSSNAASNALMYTYGWFPGIEQHFGWFNMHAAYSRQFDCAVVIGGASASNQVEGPSLSVVLPSRYINATIVPPYSVLFTGMSKSECVVGGARWMLSSGRAGCKFLGHHVYWGGGDDQHQSSGQAAVPYFFRADIRPVLANPTAPLTTTFLPERLSDMPFGMTGGAFSADPYTNTILAFGMPGVALYDATTDIWQNITSSLSEFNSTFGGGPNYMSFVHADFIDRRGATSLRKTYFFGGWNNSSTPAFGTPEYNNRFERVRSIKVTRSKTVSTFDVVAQHPENPANTFGGNGLGPLRSIKHNVLIAAGDYVYLAGGDWDDHYPVNVSGSGTPGYKIETGTGFYPPGPKGPNTQNGRQEIWRTQISTAASSGTSTWSMVGNAYAEYPWREDLGHGFYDGAQRGPFMPDGTGMFVDRNGQIWMGPCDIGYDDLRGSEMAGNEPSFAAMYKWTPPGYNNTSVTGAGVNGVALGNGWTMPNQSRLQAFSIGNPGTDWDAGLNASGNVGWGRPNKGPAYDTTDHKARVVNVDNGGSQGNRVFYVHVSAFDCAPDGNGKHNWVRQTATVPIMQMGSPPQHVVTGINTGWGQGGIGNTCQIERTLFFSLMVAYGVNDGSGNADYVGQPDTTSLLRGAIIAVDLNTFPAASSVSYIPLPQMMPWWLRTFDGPQSGDGHHPGTPGQNRGMVAVGNKLVIGPDSFHKVDTDPWIVVYDTVSKTWECFDPPAYYGITNGGHDWPNSLMALVAVPSLGEAWLCGLATLSDYGQYTPYRAANNFHDPAAYYNSTGLWASRRIFRFKVT